jgi:hypothetical protein
MTATLGFTYAQRREIPACRHHVSYKICVIKPFFASQQSLPHHTLVRGFECMRRIKSVVSVLPATKILQADSAKLLYVLSE